MLAAKHFDPVVGIDIHLIQPPGPVPPLPIPHPFVGFLIDPADYVPIIGSTVQINGMHRAQAGTAGKCVPPHIPIGGVFVPPPPGNECEMFMGSATVEVDGDAQSYMSLPALSCQSIGMPTIPRLNPKKKTKPKCLMLPLSFVLPIPAGPPVMIGGPPTISIMGLAMKAGLAALGKLAKALKKLQKGSKRWKALSDRLRAAAQKAMNKLGIPPSIQNKVSRAICAVTGHPVDIATGKVFTDAFDLELPGPLPFKWERVWYSTSTYDGPLGHGWHHSYDLALLEEEDAVAVRMADGRPVAFPALAIGGSHFDRTERLTLSRDPDGYRLTEISGISYRFGHVTFDSPIQKLLAVTDRPGFRIAFQYDKFGWLEEITDSAGRRLPVSCDDDGRILEIRGPHPDRADATIPLVSYEYGAAGDLITVRDALDQPMRFRFDNHLLIQETGRTGLSFHFEYDGTGPTARCLRTWGDGGIYDHRLDYDLDLHQTQVTNSLGYSSLFHWNSDGVVIRSIDPLGDMKMTEFNEFSQITAQTDELGRTIKFAYDDRGNRTGVTLADGAGTVFEFGEFDLPERAVDAIGGEWTWQHNEVGQIIARRDPSGAGTQLYYSGGFLTEFVDAAGRSVRLSFSREGCLESLTTPDNLRTSWTYDRLGRSLTTVMPTGARATRVYDLLGRVTRVRDLYGRERAMQYNAAGDLTRITGGTSEIVMEYQGLGRLRSRSENEVKLRFDYDTEENLLAVRNAHGEAYRFELDERQHVHSEYAFGKTRRIFTRDGAGQAIRVEFPSGRHVFYQYSPTGQLTECEHSDGDIHKFVYRPDGQLAEAANSHCTVRFERDAIGRITLEHQNDFWMATEFDRFGQPGRRTSCFGAVQAIRRGDHGSVEQHSSSSRPGDPPQWEAHIRRNAEGTDIQRSLPGGLQSRWEKDSAGLPVRNEISTGGGFRRSVNYEWGAGAILRSIADSVRGVTNLEYDGIGRLIAATHDDGPAEIRLPDEVGNLFQTRERNDRQYGPAGELLEAVTAQGRVRFEYDPDGRLIRKHTAAGTWQFQWNAAGLLTAVDRPGGSRIEFTYDALGRRLSKTVNGVTTRWIWDKSEPVHEWTEPVAGAAAVEDESLPPQVETSGTAVSTERLVATMPATGPPAFDAPPVLDAPAGLITWVFDPDSFRLTARVTQNTVHTILTDHIGTPTAAFDVGGQLAWSTGPTIYGSSAAAQGDASLCPFRFQGQYEDAETGLCYNRYRYYDPETGVYLSRDPIGLLGGARLYGYVGNPTLEVDPFGLAPGDSAALDNAMNGAVGDNLQAHHLVPCQVWDNHQGALDAMGMERNAAGNGLHMPSNTTAQPGAIGHIGSHPQYNALVEAEVSAITNSLPASPTPAQLAAARKDMEDLQTKLRTNILNHDPSIPVGPSGSHPCKLK